jgi:hypothetical protein
VDEIQIFGKNNGGNYEWYTRNPNSRPQENVFGPFPITTTKYTDTYDEEGTLIPDTVGSEVTKDFYSQYPSDELLAEHGYMLKIAPVDFDDSLHKLVQDSYSDNGVNVWQDYRDKTAQELEAAAISDEKNKIETMSINIQAHLDQKAIDHGYDNIVNACGYAAAVNPFQAESIQFVVWRGNVWAYAYQVLADVKAEVRTEPTIDEMLSELPVFN